MDREIVVLDGYTENPGDLSWAGFEALGRVRVYDRTPFDQAAARIGGAQIVLTNKTPITAQTLQACPQVEYIGVLATGYNVVDTEAAKARGVTVTNVPAYGTQAVGQFAIAMLLEICHHIGHHDQAVKAGRWAQSGDFCFWDYPLMELAGKTMGIVGLGRIGQVTARIAAALGMEVIAYDKTHCPQGEALARYVSLEELYRRSHVICLHCPLFEDNRGMINRSSIAQMRDGVIIINNSRGPLIVEEDLAQALHTGKVYAAGLDVTCTEPIEPDNPLLKAPNCLITPHISWASRESRARLMDTAVENLRAFLAGAAVNQVAG